MGGAASQAEVTGRQRLAGRGSCELIDLVQRDTHTGLGKQELNKRLRRDGSRGEVMVVSL